MFVLLLYIMGKVYDISIVFIFLFKIAILYFAKTTRKEAFSNLYVNQYVSLA